MTTACSPHIKVDTWQTRGRMVVIVNHGSATGLSLTLGQTVEIEKSTLFSRRSSGRPVDKRRLFCKGITCIIVNLWPDIYGELLLVVKHRSATHISITTIVYLSQQGIWVSFGHKNPQEWPSGHLNNTFLKLLCLVLMSKYMFIVIIRVFCDVPLKKGYPKIFGIAIFGHPVSKSWRGPCHH